MKHLYLVRHGKSSWADGSLADEERPLKKRGERDARLMSRLLKEEGITPGIIISSHANRALTTARIFARHLSYEEHRIIINEQLYFEGLNAIMDIVNTLNDDTGPVFLFGHNPDFTAFANRFSKQEIDNVPTSGVVGVAFKAQRWKEAAFSNGKMIFFDYPSNHR